jgi:hypothetical protein
MISERIFDRLPESAKPITRKMYYLTHPNKSFLQLERERGYDDLASEIDWKYMSRFIDVEDSGKDKNKSIKERIQQEVEQLFDDKSEYDEYVDEFWDGQVPDIMRKASREVDGGFFINDSHQSPCEFYYALIRKYEPKNIIETGVHNGVSTLSMLAALKKNGGGKLQSINDPNSYDYYRNSEEKYEWKEYIRKNDKYCRARPSCAMPNSTNIPPDKTVGWIIPEDYKNRWELIESKPQKKLPEILAQNNTIDIFLHDSETTASTMMFEFELAWNWLNSNGFLLSHHIGWNDVFQKFINEHDCDGGIVTFHGSDLTEYDNGDPRLGAPGSTGYIQR